jgi:hypothetical protein
MDKIMPIKLRDKYIEKLNNRFAVLQNLLDFARKLDSPADGCRTRYRWPNPDAMCKINKIEINLAVEDLKSILAELKRG